LPSTFCLSPASGEHDRVNHGPGGKNGKRIERQREWASMNSILKKWRRIGLQLKLQILIQGFLLVILLFAQLWIYYQLEGQIMDAAQDWTAVVADGVINGLNTLMVTKVGTQDVISDADARSTFIQKMAASDKVKLGLHSVAELTHYAIRTGMITI
jgi:hypothetical protein